MSNKMLNDFLKQKLEPNDLSKEEITNINKQEFCNYCNFIEHGIDASKCKMNLWTLNTEDIKFKKIKTGEILDDVHPLDRICNCLGKDHSEFCNRVIELAVRPKNCIDLFKAK